MPKDKVTACFLNPFPPKSQREVLHDINYYLRIDSLELRGGLHVASLRGLDQEIGGSYFLGLLLAYIDCNSITLEVILNADAPIQLRQR